MTAWARGLRLALVSSVALAACTGGSGRDRAESTTTTATRTMSPLRDRPLPPPVSVRDRPDGVALADPAFEALPGAHAEFGTLGGAVYQIEMPDQWNGRVVLWMHGFEDLAPEANATAPDFRRYLIAHGFAWAASSFSSTSLIPGRAADETAALWDYFVTEQGRPTWSYVAGMSMGGWAAHIAAERYGDRFDGALGLCGAAGTTPGLRISAEVLVAGAYVAGVTQAEFDSAPSASDLIERRIRPAMRLMSSGPTPALRAGRSIATRCACPPTTRRSVDSPTAPRSPANCRCPSSPSTPPATVRSRSTRLRSCASA